MLDVTKAEQRFTTGVIAALFLSKGFEGLINAIGITLKPWHYITLGMAMIFVYR